MASASSDEYTSFYSHKILITKISHVKGGELEYIQCVNFFIDCGSAIHFVFLWTGVRCPVVPQLIIEIVLTADGL